MKGLKEWKPGNCRCIFLIMLFASNAYGLKGQSISADPDSVLAEWVETGEWAGVSLHPDIALEWLQEMDSSRGRTEAKPAKQSHLLSFTVPGGSGLLQWDSLLMNSTIPLSLKYRFNASEHHRWEFRLQVNQYAGDSLPGKPDSGWPRQLAGGLLIRPGSILQEVVLGDFQVNAGFGAVAGSSPVFSVALGNPGSLLRTGKGIRLYSGPANGRFFRGLAARFLVGKSEMLVYGSGKYIVNQDVIGFGWTRDCRAARFGVAGLRVNDQYPPPAKTGWDASWQPDSGRYSRVGVWGQAKVPFGMLFAEFGWSPLGGAGWITGFRWFEAHGFSAVIRYTGCSPGYPVPYSIFQSGSGRTREGQRMISSFSYSPVRRFEWLGSIEVGLSQWPGSNAKFNNSSTRISHQIKILAVDSWVATGGIQIDFAECEGAAPQKTTWKLALDSDPKQTGIRFRAGFRQQLQGSGVNFCTGTTADCSLSLPAWERRLRLTAGIRIFRAEAGSDPLYAYEPDVLYGWSAPVFSGSGTRWFVTVRLRLQERFDVEFKISRTAWSDLRHQMDETSGGLSGKLLLIWRIAE